MNRWLALLLACAALSLVAAGCGSDDDDEGGGEAQTTEQPDDDGGGGGGGTEVSMKNIKFVPANLTVSAGDTVTWVNDDTVGHDVTGDDFKSGEPGAMQNGDTYENTFDEAGTFKYVCTVHPGMEGAVTVE